MAKKKRRKKKFRGKVYKVRNGTNKHHILWEKSRYAKREWANKLRTHEFCVVEMPIVEHQMIHERLRLIPEPSESSCQLAYEEICRLWDFGAINSETDIKLRIELLIFLLEYIEPLTVEALRKQLAIICKIRGA